MDTETDDQMDTGDLQLFVAVTAGSDASCQVSHAEKPRKECDQNVTWRREFDFHGFATLQTSEQAFHDLCGVTMSVFTLLLYLLPSQRQRSSDVTREDRLVLFLMKLKLGVSLTALGALFGVTKSTASRVFHLMLDHLSTKLEKWIFVPPRTTIKDTMPACFTANYPNCTFIIDCTEVRTETPSDPEQQHYLYSHYKGGYTLKWLVGIIPNGMIAFVSEPYGGRHSDSLITRQSGFLTHVLPGDLVMSDKGFPAIKTTMEEQGAVLLMPPFNTGGGQLSVEDMNSTFVIAQVRIHVERELCEPCELFRG
ncbi:uncharacterized protein LOC135401290 [Ornithodoros turicata]|uniref:uncharacterized protein LOC135401290 n=1 Tax=Ornithodoros turicata TaxID=34597 RepID=UPI003139C990